MTDRQLRDEVVTLVLAGHETTALVLFYTFYLLAQSPESADRLAAELHDVLGDRAPTAADVPNLRYTEWVVRESMRLYPPAWGIAREALADCEIGGYHVPKGTQIFMVQWLVHRDRPLVRRPGGLPARAMGQRPDQAIAPLRVFSIRRRAAHLHRQPLRHDGGRAYPGHDRAAISPGDRAGPDTRAPAIDHASAPTPDPHAAQGKRARGDAVTRNEPRAVEPVPTTWGLSPRLYDFTRFASSAVGNNATRRSPAPLIGA